MQSNKGIAVGIIAVIVIVLVGIVAYGAGKRASAPVVVEDSTQTPALQSDNTALQSGQNVEDESPALTQEIALQLVASEWNWVPGQESRLSVTISQSSGQYYVTADMSGGDDSIATFRRVAPAMYTGGQWTLGQVTTSQKCHVGRGHQDFSAAACI